jgi:hypothetical protein
MMDVYAERSREQIEKIAKQILADLDQVFCVKLKELKRELLQVREYFHTEGHSNILGCETWAAFCEEKLHRTKQAVNKMLKEEHEPSGKKVSTTKSEPEEEQEEDWETAKSAAKKKVRHFFSPLDKVKAIEEKMNDLLEGLIPCRKFVVTVKEVTEEAL